MSHRIVFIGAGNLATRLSSELKKNGCIIEQVYSRTFASASALGQLLQSGYTSTPEAVIRDADIYFIALKDSAIENVLPHISVGNNLLVHCSGSLSISWLSKYAVNYGVFYPLQTFSKHREVNFMQIPVFVEGSSKRVEDILLRLAKSISSKASVLDSERRLFLHIAAVFSCNFVNYFYTIAADMLQAKNIQFDVLHPLINETASKVLEMQPIEAQTGPAVRYDRNIINKHMDVLEEYPEFRELYKIVSDSIHQYHKKL